MVYNALNQVTQANITTPQGASVINYAYDHDGIRIGKTINGTEVVQYVVDKNRPYAQVLEEERTNGLLSGVTNYVYGDALISSTTEGLTHYYHADGLGSVRHLSDASGALTDSYTYDAYGLLTTSSGATVNPYLYRGEQYDADLNAYYLRARYYQPGTGRFLTTDPMEGFPTTPMSLHRYIYGNDNPGNIIDPSGKVNLAVQIVTCGIISYLSTIPLVIAEHLGIGIYSTLVKYVLPEAYIIGVNVTGMMPYELMKKYLEYMNMIFDQAPCPVMDLSFIPWANMSVGFGGELLLSVGSGEAGFFTTYSIGSAVGTSPTFAGGFELYDGFVYNLWNVGDYNGPFESLSVSTSSFSLAWSPSWTLFWDGPRGFEKGPWGGASSFLSKSASLFPQAFSIGQASTVYELKGKPYTLPRAAVVLGIYKLLTITKLIESIDQGGNILPFAFLVPEMSLWTHIGLAHHYWNINEEKYNLTDRRDYNKARPDDYRSGPSSWKPPL